MIIELIKYLHENNSQLAVSGSNQRLHIPDSETTFSKTWRQRSLQHVRANSPKSPRNVLLGI